VTEQHAGGANGSRPVADAGAWPPDELLQAVELDERGWLRRDLEAIRLVAAVRGVNVDGVFRTLLARGLVREVGRDDGPGQAVLYGTTAAFLEQLGLNTLDDLPPIKDYLPEGVEMADLQDQP